MFILYVGYSTVLIDTAYQEKKTINDICLP